MYFYNFKFTVCFVCHIFGFKLRLELLIQFNIIKCKKINEIINDSGLAVCTGQASC